MAQPCRDIEQDVEEDHGGHANPDPVLILGHTPAAKDGSLQSNGIGPQKRWSEGNLYSACSFGH